MEFRVANPVGAKGFSVGSQAIVVGDPPPLAWIPQADQVVEAGFFRYDDFPAGVGLLCGYITSGRGRSKMPKTGEERVYEPKVWDSQETT